MKKLIWKCPYCFKEVFGEGIGIVLKLNKKRIIAHLGCARQQPRDNPQALQGRANNKVKREIKEG